MTVFFFTLLLGITIAAPSWFSSTPSTVVESNQCDSEGSKACTTFPTGNDGVDGLKVCTQVPERLLPDQVYPLKITVESRITMRDVFITVQEQGSRLDYFSATIDDKSIRAVETGGVTGFQLGILKAHEKKVISIPAHSKKQSDSAGACVWASYTPYHCACGHKIDFQIALDIDHPCSPPSFAYVTVENKATTPLTNLRVTVDCFVKEERVAHFKLNNIPTVAAYKKFEEKHQLDFSGVRGELKCTGVAQVEDEKRSINVTVPEPRSDIRIKWNDVPSKLYFTDKTEVCFEYEIIAGLPSKPGSDKSRDPCHPVASLNVKPSSNKEHGLKLVPKVLQSPSTYCAEVEGALPETHCLIAEVGCTNAPKNGKCSKVEEKCITVLPLAAILVEVLDVRDALFVGDKVYYEIVVINQGPEPLTNIEVMFGWDEREMEFVHATGATGLLDGTNNKDQCSRSGYRLLGSSGSNLKFFQESLSPTNWGYGLKCFKPLPTLAKLPADYSSIPNNWCFYKAGDTNEGCASSILDSKNVDNSREVSKNRARWVVEMKAKSEAGTRLVVWVADAKLPLATVETETTQLHKSFSPHGAIKRF